MSDIEVGSVWTFEESRKDIEVSIDTIVTIDGHVTEIAYTLPSDEDASNVSIGYFLRNFRNTGRMIGGLVADDIVEHDAVNHPSHYTSDPSGVECITITRHRNNNIGNAIKYLWRNGLKECDSNTQDLEKAVYYIKDEIQRLESMEGDK